MKPWLNDLFRLCRQERKWLLAPLLLILILAVAVIFLLVSNSGISWALYPSK